VRRQRHERGARFMTRLAWRTWSFSTRILVAVVVVAVLAAVGAAAWLYTPVTDVKIINDRAVSVTVANCGDPETIAPGAKAIVQAVSDRRDDLCEVYSGADQLQGCIGISPHQPPARVSELKLCDATS
jgi:hypothetical protein